MPRPGTGTRIPRRFRFRLVIAGLAAGSLGVAGFDGCDRGPGTVSPGAFTTTDSAGVAIATTIFSEDLTQLDQEQGAALLLDIGAGAGNRAGIHLHQVADASWLRDGRIAVLNGGSSELLIFSSDGLLVVRAGGEGEGPGEFRRPSGMVELGPDSILVYDAGNGRLTVLAVSGELIETRSLASVEDGPPWAYRPGGLLGDSAIIMIAQAFGPQLRDPPGRYEHTTPHLVYGRDGEVMDSIGEGLRADAFGTPTYAGLVAYGRFSTADAHDGLLYEADGRPYEIRVYGLDGLRRIVRLDRPPRTPSPAEDEAHLEYLESLAENPASRLRGPELYDQTPRADTKPWIRDVRVAREGRIWVREWEPSWMELPVTWGIFDTDGRWLGSLTLPDLFRLTDVREDRMLGVWTDELDVEQVRVYGSPEALSVADAPVGPAGAP